jgi:hypothetical protein
MTRFIGVEYVIKDIAEIHSPEKEKKKSPRLIFNSRALKARKESNLKADSGRVHFQEPHPDSHLKVPKFMMRPKSGSRRIPPKQANLDIPWDTSRKCADRDILNMELDNHISKIRNPPDSKRVPPEPVHSFQGPEHKNDRVSVPKSSHRSRLKPNTFGAILRPNIAREGIFPGVSEIHAGKHMLANDWCHPAACNHIVQDIAKPQARPDTSREALWSAFNSTNRKNNFGLIKSLDSSENFFP